MLSVLSPAVIRAARTRQRRRRVLAVAALVAAAALLWIQPWKGGPSPSLHRSTTTRATAEARLVGSWMVVASGRDWNLVVKPGYPGRLCISYGAPGENASGCVPAPRSARPLPPPLVVAGSLPHHERVIGLTTSRIGRVTLVMPGGRNVSAPSKPLPSFQSQGNEAPALGVYALDVRLAGSRLPRSTLVAYGPGGKILGRFAL
jgi:hypothetical protein